MISVAHGHSLNYMHFGSAETSYGVPCDATLSFKDVVHVQRYGRELNPLGEAAFVFPFKLCVLCFFNY
jgi:hypothetical protein